MRPVLIAGVLGLNVVAVLATLDWAHSLLQDNVPSQSPRTQSRALITQSSDTGPTGQAIARYAAAPLFRKDRAFDAALQETVTPAVGSSAPPRAVGTLLSTTANKWVLLVHPDTQALQKVAEGETFAGWDVTNITETSVQLQRRDMVLTKPIRP